jgi:hypothetical protein
VAEKNSAGEWKIVLLQNTMITPSAVPSWRIHWPRRIRIRAIPQ